MAVAANSATRFGDLNQQRRNGADGAFFVPVAQHARFLWWACGAAFGLAGFLCYRFANPARPPPSLQWLGWSSNTYGQRGKTVATIQDDADQSASMLAIGGREGNWLDEFWGASGLPSAVSNRLCRIDECMHGLEGITEIIRRDGRNLTETKSDPEKRYTPLSPGLRESLYCAQRALLGDIRSRFEDLQEMVGKHGRSVLR